MTDLTYTRDGLFTVFYPDTKAGEVAWRQMADQTEGTGAVLAMHEKAVIQQLRAAGYKVRKAHKDNMAIDQILEELDA